MCGPTALIHELRISARLVSLSRPTRRSVSTSTRSQFLTMPWNPWVSSSDNVLSSWPNQLSHFCNFCSCQARKMEGAELSPSCTQHVASPCVWYQHTPVNGMSSLQVSGTLRSRVTQRSEHMLRGGGHRVGPQRGSICDPFSPKAHVLIPQLVARRYPFEILVLG